MQIILSKLRFFGRHGLHPEEAILGGEFYVDALIEVDVPETSVDIEDTVDYTCVYALIKQRMSSPSTLIETLANEICTAILSEFKAAGSVTITITKSNPPIINFEGSVAVAHTLKRKHL